MEIVNTWKLVYLKMFPYFAGLLQAVTGGVDDATVS